MERRIPIRRPPEVERMGFVTAEVYNGLLFERDERWRRIGIRLSMGGELGLGAIFLILIFSF